MKDWTQTVPILPKEHQRQKMALLRMALQFTERLNSSGDVKTINVWNHFNPIIIKTGVVYVASMGAYFRNEFPTEHKMAAVLDGGTKYKYKTNANTLSSIQSNYFTAGLLTLEIDNLEDDLVYVEYTN